MNKRRLLVSLALLLALVLASVLRDFVRDNVLTPALHLLWLLRLEFERLPQSYLWIALIVIGLLLAGSQLLAHTRPARRFIATGLERGGPIETLTRWFDLALYADYYKWRIAQRLGELALDVLAEREQLNREQVKARLAAGQLDLPPEIRAYLQAGLSPDTLNDLSRPTFRFSSHALFSPLDLPPEKVVQYLETKREQ
ncbi:MAG TPA: hypothetical protein VJG32_20375 [Anaerolineae bacterium]|nr:hypothetical protein [Anaerolineae bacterium]